MNNYKPHVKKQIIKNFAEQAGISKELFLGGLCVIDVQDLERFDEIIRQDERETCAALVEADGRVHEKAPDFVWAKTVAKLIRARGNHGQD